MADIHKLNERKRPPKPPKWKSEVRVCVHCAEQYSPIRYKQKYCSVECRNEFWARNRRWMPDPETVQPEELQEFLRDYLRQCHFLPDHGEVTFTF